MSKREQESKSRKKHLIDLIPKDSVSARILTERAHQLAKPSSKTVEDKQEVHYVRFKLGKERYGIAFSYIKEVIPFIAPTKVPFTTKSIAGIINRHGTLIPVFNLIHYFNLVSAVDIKNTRFIVVAAKNTILAIGVEIIEGSDSFHSTELSPPLQFQGAIKPDYIQGLHQGTIAMINIEALISSILLNTMQVKESLL